MPIRIEAWTAGGILTGNVAWPGHLRDALESAPQLAVSGATFAALDGTPSGPPTDLPLVVDDLILATSDEPLPGHVHAAWHGVAIEAGPYRIEGELATLPGFDPGRALTRPTGEFVHLRDVRISLIERPDAGVETYPEGLVNRYLVDVVESDLMLGFFFPGARIEGSGALPPPPSPSAGVGTHGHDASLSSLDDAADATGVGTLVGGTIADSSEAGPPAPNGSAAPSTA